MDNLLIGKPFRLDGYITYPCPSCGKNSLKHNKDKFYSRQSAGSLKAADDYYFEPDWIKEVFTSVLICEDSECNEVVTCTGVGYVDFEIVINEYGEQEQEFFTYYEPQVFIPALQYINIPSECPDEVLENLQEAFSLTLLSPSSAANKVRAAIENLLSEYNIPKYKIQRGKGGGKGRRIFISLHERIVIAGRRKKIFDELNGILIAIKWLGNEGSHATSGITHNDIFDAYRLTEHILNVLYPSDMNLQKKAKEIVKNKGVKKTKKT